MKNRERIGLAVLASAGIVGIKLFYDYLRKHTWGRFW